MSIINWANAADYFYAANWSGATTDTRGAAPMNQITFGGFGADQTQWKSFDSQITPVPEPSFYGLCLMAGTLGAALLRFWRKGPMNAALWSPSFFCRIQSQATDRLRWLIS